MNFFFQDPDAIMDYGIDWSRWLDGAGITTSTWTLAPVIDDDDVAITDESIIPLPAPDEFTPADNTLVKTVFWLSGGFRGRTYSITNHIVASDGREDDEIITIRIKDK